MKSFRCKLGIHDYEYILDKKLLPWRLLKVCLRCEKTMSFIPSTRSSYSRWIDIKESARRQKLAMDIHNHD